MAISTYNLCLLITNRELETFSILGYLLVLVNKSSRQDNTLTKYKRVTRSVLALEIYSIVSGVDIAIAILTTLKIIIERLGLPSIPLVIYTDLYSLYECLVKLSTTNEKRLIIDIIALRQSYERHNPANALTKATLNRALKQFINSNMLLIRVEGSVQRPTE
ncbi:hypothetical protein BU23DRAFT_579836 [Bimuria novae-zelandiae CBS 107.79]|uniref:Reverse transcriptase Ty1/copia-type domain-containing protein n=1 Tax=Bimuria novae-zelandiae CBS 107.79 TaxID=1447943 RepID=A0A6A5VAF8_9PLEO|nr:hypothetical protein BU23DRAFT_579836 [Bimuria novae-zelandiae CBS 107.79]